MAQGDAQRLIEDLKELRDEESDEDDTDEETEEDNDEEESNETDDEWYPSVERIIKSLEYYGIYEDQNLLLRNKST